MDDPDEKNTVLKKFNDAYNKWASREKNHDLMQTLAAFSTTLKKLQQYDLPVSFENTSEAYPSRGTLKLGRLRYFTNARADNVFVENLQYHSAIDKCTFHTGSPEQFENWAIDVLAFDRVQQEIAAESAVPPKSATDTRKKMPLIPRQAKP